MPVAVGSALGDVGEHAAPQLRLSPVAKDFLSGAIAGAGAISITQPLDTVRIRLQHAVPYRTPQLATNGTGAALGHVIRTRPPPPNTAFSILHNLVASEGLRAPWKGMAMPLVFASVQNAVVFSIYNSMIRLQLNQQEQQQQQQITGGGGQGASHDGGARQLPTPWMGFVAGCAAGFGQVFVWSPVEMVKVRLQLQSASRGDPGYQGPLQMARKVWSKEGLPGMYRGVTVTALRDVPSFGVYFGLYHAFVALLEGSHIHPDDAQATTHLLAGGTAGALSWVGVYWLDVAKTRMQAVSRVQTPGMTWMHFAREIYRKEGGRALLRGMPTTLARSFIMDAVAFLGFRMSLKVMDSH